MDQPQTLKEKKAIKEAAQWVANALSEMDAAIKAGDIQRMSIANDRVERKSSCMKNELRRLAGFNEV
jgi:hypothetical protein